MNSEKFVFRTTTPSVRLLQRPQTVTCYRVRGDLILDWGVAVITSMPPSRDGFTAKIQITTMTGKLKQFPSSNHQTAKVQARRILKHMLVSNEESYL